MTEPRIAYLVVAHHQPHHLARMVDALRDERARFFIHVDAKSDIAPFEPIGRSPDVWLAQRRLRVYWGGLSQVKVARLLLRKATEGRHGFERFCLLSGGDYPIKPCDEIAERLLGSDRELIRIDRRLSDTPRNSHFEFVERLHLNDVALFNPRTPIRPRRLQKASLGALNAVARRLPRRRFYPGVVPYHGSAFWCLSAPCVEYVLRFLDEHPDYVRHHRYVHVPDEVMIHSIVKASPFAERISQDFEQGTAEGDVYGCHFIDWRTEGVTLPKVLDESDLPRLASSPALFARKFDELRSQRLLTMLDDRLAGGSD